VKQTFAAQVTWRLRGPGLVMYHAAEAAGFNPDERVEILEPLDEDATQKDAEIAFGAGEIVALVKALAFVAQSDADQDRTRVPELRLQVSIEGGPVEAWAELSAEDEGDGSVALDASAVAGDLAQRIEAARQALNNPQPQPVAAAAATDPWAEQ